MVRSLDALERFIASLPRLPLGLFPTPLVRLDRLGADLGIELWMKRDDCTGLALGGNKTRKLEFILADARARGYETLVTTGPVTSNHTMMTAMAARRAGFAVHCVIGGARPPVVSGNLLLTEYMGATLHFSPINFADPDPADEARLRATCRAVVEATGGYWIPGGGTMPQAEPGYMSAVAEIARQRGGRFDFDHVVLALGTGSTTTGLLLGLALAGFTRTRVWAIAVGSRHALEEVFKRPTTAALFDESAAHLGLDVRTPDAPSNEVVYGFAEEGYGVPNEGGDRAIRMMAEREGYFLDPVYTAKAFAGLLALVADGRIPARSRVLFMHTGGLSMTPAAEKQFRAPQS